MKDSKPPHKTYFITAIDTDAGKTIITGAIARYLLEQGVNVITQKLAQTGCIRQSDDILEHRRIMKTELFAEDKEGLTCPYLFSFPCSPHLAAALENKQIVPAYLKSTTEQLSEKYECVLLEGVGGLMVPLNDELLLIDYLQECSYPVILVTSGKLGSINHTLLSLDACANRGIKIVGLVFNHYGSANKTITNDTLVVFRNKLQSYYPDAQLVEVPVIHQNSKTINFGDLF